MLSFIVIITSLCSQYGPGMAELVIDNRQSGNAWASLPKVLPETDGYIAVQDCSEIGDTWWIKNPITDNWESFLVIDCSRPAGTDGAVEWMEENNIAMEVDYKTAIRWDTVGRGIYVEWSRHMPINGEIGYVELQND